MKQLQLKELYELAEKGEPLQEVYGVKLGEYDPDFSSPPEGLQSIGFVAELSGDSGINPDLIDVMISYGLENLPVLLEVPAHLLRNFSVKDLMAFANNLEVSVSILPPGHPLVDESVTLEEYNRYISEITHELLNLPDLSVDVQPVSNYITYLMLEVILGDKVKQVFKVKSEYVLENFVSVLSEEASDGFKAIIKDVVYNHYGNKENFYNIANVLVNQVYDLSKSKFKEAVVAYVEEQKKLAVEGSTETKAE